MVFHFRPTSSSAIFKRRNAKWTLRVGQIYLGWLLHGKIKNIFPWTACMWQSNCFRMIFVLIFLVSVIFALSNEAFVKEIIEYSEARMPEAKSASRSGAGSYNVRRVYVPGDWNYIALYLSMHSSSKKYFPIKVSRISINYKEFPLKREQSLQFHSKSKDFYLPWNLTSNSSQLSEYSWQARCNKSVRHPARVSASVTATLNFLGATMAYQSKDMNHN